MGAPGPLESSAGLRGLRGLRGVEGVEAVEFRGEGVERFWGV